MWLVARVCAKLMSVFSLMQARTLTVYLLEIGTVTWTLFYSSVSEGRSHDLDRVSQAPLEASWAI